MVSSMDTCANRMVSQLFDQILLNARPRSSSTSEGRQAKLDIINWYLPCPKGNPFCSSLITFKQTRTPGVTLMKTQESAENLVEKVERVHVSTSVAQVDTPIEAFERFFEPIMLHLTGLVNKATRIKQPENKN
jgi:hypothetical protein